MAQSTDPVNDLNALTVAMAKLQVTQETILQELRELKPRVSWLESKMHYAMGIVAVAVLFGDTILHKLGIK